MSKNKKRILGILRITALSLISVILGINIYLWNANSLVGDQLPMPFGYGAAVVLSGSMEPELSVDDVIIVHKTEDYSLRDVVVYQSQGSLVVHRVVNIDGEQITTRGDANDSDDAAIGVDVIKGEVVGVLSGMGGVIRLLKTPWAFLALLAAAVVGLELSFRKERQKGDEDLDKIKEEIRRLKAEQEKE